MVGFSFIVGIVIIVQDYISCKRVFLRALHINADNIITHYSHSSQYSHLTEPCRNLETHVLILGLWTFQSCNIYFFITNILYRATHYSIKNNKLSCLRFFFYNYTIHHPFLVSDVIWNF